MNWKNLKIGTKLIIGFGSLIILIVTISSLSLFVFSNLKKSNQTLVQKKDNTRFILEKKLDHLHWAAKITDLFMKEEVNTLEVETECTKCGLGKWIYSDSTAQMMEKDKELAQLIDQVKAPHETVHKSAVAIKDNYQAFDISLNGILAERWIEHLLWIKDLNTSLGSNLVFKGNIDPHRCRFGKWYDTYKAKDPEFAGLLNKWESPHEKLHNAAADIVLEMKNNNLEIAKTIYNEQALPALNKLAGCYNGTMDWIDTRIDRQKMAVDIFHTQTIPALEKTQAILDKIVNHFEEESGKSVLVMDKTMSKNRIYILVFTAGSVILGFFAAGMITRMIAHPLARSAEFADNMAQGDFTKRLDINQKDEIGTLARAMNKMTSNLGKMFSEISRDVDILNLSSSELSAISLQMHQGSEQTSNRAEKVAVASEEMRSNMTSVSAATEQTAANVGMVASATEEMSSTVNEIAQNSQRARGITDKAVKQALSASEKVEDLGESARKINHVVETINDISDQVNLLALNATIEAARAGEAGKGFAVVAKEIKDLASQTAEATQEIKENISYSQNATKKIVYEIEEVSNVIKDINDIVTTISTAVEEQAVTTREVAQNISQASEGIQEVTNNVSQSTAVAGEITRDIAGVTQEAGEISASSSQVNIRAEQLSKLAEKLTKMIDQFKLP